MDRSTSELDEALAAVTASVQQNNLEAAFAALGALRARFPQSAVVALRWCWLACTLNRPGEVPSYGGHVYQQSACHLERAHLSSLIAYAHGIQQQFDQAWSWCQRGLDHLILLAQQGKRPLELPRAVPSPAFASGEAERRLWQVTAALRRAGLPAFPFFGTLLGLVRNGSLLPFDKDIDLAVWQDHFQGACQWLDGQGWRRAGNTILYDNYACFIDPQSGLTLDVSGLRREPEHPRITGGLWLYAHPPAWQRITRFPWFELATRASPAGDVYWPQQPEAVLSALYGDWRVPRPNWDSMISACNLEAVTLQVQLHALTRLLTLWLDGHLDRARDYLDQVRRRLPNNALLLSAQWALDKMLASPAAAS